MERITASLNFVFVAKICIILAADLLLIKLFRCTEQSVARIVDYNINFSQIGKREIKCAPYRTFIAYI